MSREQYAKLRSEILSTQLPTLETSFPLIFQGPLSHNENKYQGAWMAQLLSISLWLRSWSHPRVLGSSPALGSLLSRESASPSPTHPAVFSLSVSLRQINKYIILKKEEKKKISAFSKTKKTKFLPFAIASKWSTWHILNPWKCNADLSPLTCVHANDEHW